jgi:hypothetical protein
MTRQRARVSVPVRVRLGMQYRGIGCHPVHRPLERRGGWGEGHGDGEMVRVRGLRRTQDIIACFVTQCVGQATFLKR